jgi:putative transcriptional regulator
MTHSFYSHRADHTEYGSTGVIINRTKSSTLSEECPEVSRRKNNLYWNALSSEVVGIGGPVGLSSPHDRSVIALTTKEQPGLTDEIVPGIHVVTDLDSLALMNSKFTGPGTLAPSDLCLFVGYSGWAPGQLQSEIDVGFWNVASASGGFIRDSMFRNVMDTIVDPDGKRRPIDAHGFRAWASMCANLGLED